MKNKKGFTLIELLAVIIILAVIALIAIPVVLSMTNNARRSAAKSSTLGFIDAIEYYAEFSQAKAGGLEIEGYDVSLPINAEDTEIECILSEKSWGSCQNFMNEVTKKLKGSLPTSATINISKSGKVLADSVFIYNGFECKYDGKDADCGGKASTPSVDETLENGKINNDGLIGYVSLNDFKNDSVESITINGKTYSAHIYTFDGNQTWNDEKKFGDDNDIATSTTDAKNMVIVKVNGDLTIGENGKVLPYYSEYGGPKGLFLYVSGTLTNKGIIDNSHGAKAEGEDVYLFKYKAGNYEYVPASGGLGASGVIAPSSAGMNGSEGTKGLGRQTGGGGSGGAWYDSVKSGNASAGTSYSGGSGSGAVSRTQNSSTNASLNGGNGGKGVTGNQVNTASGGAGNPGGLGQKKASDLITLKADDGTGGLLILYAGKIINNSKISANGANGGPVADATGGASGGGSINIFYSTSYQSSGIIEAKGGETFGTVKGGSGGSGTINTGKITNDLYYPYITASDFKKEITIIKGTKEYLPKLLGLEYDNTAFLSKFKVKFGSNILKFDSDNYLVSLENGSTTITIEGDGIKVNINAIVSELPKADIYVMKSGNDTTASGTSSKPYASVDAAIRSAKDGDKIYIDDGTYDLSEIIVSGDSSVGISDLGKNLEIFGNNEKTILIYEGAKGTLRDANAINLSNSSSVLRNLTYIYKPAKSYSYSNAIFYWTLGTTKNVFFIIDGSKTASHIYYNDQKVANDVINCTFYHKAGSVTSSWSGKTNFTNIATNVATGGTVKNVIVNNFATSTMSYKEIVDASVDVDEFINANVGVYRGENAWKVKLREEEKIEVDTSKYPEADIYVTAYGRNATADGSKKRPYATLSAAITAAKDGDKIYIHDGTYELNEMISSDSAGVGIYDLGKKIEVFGNNEKTILILDSSKGLKRDSCVMTLSNPGSIVRNLTYIYKPAKVYNYSNAMFRWTLGTTENVFFIIDGVKDASYLYYNDQVTPNNIVNCTFYHKSGAKSSNWSGKANFKNIATNVDTGATKDNVVVNSFATSTMTYSDIINASKNNDSFKSASVGVFFGDNAWK